MQRRCGKRWSNKRAKRKREGFAPLFFLLHKPYFGGFKAAGAAHTFKRDKQQERRAILLFWYKGFARQAGAVIHDAIRVAQEMGHTYVGTEHLLMALLRTDTTDAACYLVEKQIYGYRVGRVLTQRVGQGKRTHLSARDFTQHLSGCLDYAVLEAKATEGGKATPTHLLTALLEVPCGAGEVLAQLGLEPALAAKEYERRSGKLPLYNAPPPRPQGRPAGRVAEKYSRDLTLLALHGEIDPVLGRDDEILRMEQILARRRKNNPCLIGAPGVGKTAVVEGLALRIAQGKAPAILREKRILALDIASLVAGTKYRGDFEDRFKNVLSDVQRAGDTILFIDEVHAIIGAGAAEGGIDASSILKPMLARGEIQIIGATTSSEYRKIEKDAALARRFGTIDVAEPTPETALKILQGVAPCYESHHNVTIEPEAIRAAVQLSVRYLPERNLPDKAIDLLDEACSAACISEKSDGRITAELVEEVVSRQSGVPAERLSQSESARMAHLEEELERCVVGQQPAVRAVASALRCARLGLASETRPMGAFLFLGPTGVGKTALARALAECCMGSGKALLRFDMSEYMEKHTAARLIGAPPGYVGYGEGGQLTEAVRRRPYSVVLFDEIEKAHPDVSNLLLQILEDGRLTDSEGRVVDFRHTLIILTSNLGAKHLVGQKGALGFGAAAPDQAVRMQVLGEAKAFFSPELLGRMDELLVFQPLDKESLQIIGSQMLAQLEERAAGQGIVLEHTPAALRLLVESGYDPACGARSLRHVITRKVEQCLASQMLSQEGDAFLLDAAAGELALRPCEPACAAAGM